jgi:LEA14-like dessication related protein
MKKQTLDFKNDDELITYLKATNPRQQPLTVERLKSYPGCENYTDEQATKIIQILENLAVCMMALTTPENIQSIDNQLNVYLNKESDNHCSLKKNAA